MSIFSYISGLRPGRSRFNLSHTKMFDANMGILYPVCAMEALPGDVFPISGQTVVRAQPLVAPVLHEISIKLNYFFIPTRLLWDEWEEFITGGKSGDYEGKPPKLGSDAISPLDRKFLGKHTLDDFFGMPIEAQITEYNEPNVFLWRAYNFVWNEYYRSQDLQDEIDLENRLLLRRAWRKDYFTVSLPSLQRGTVPAMPIEVHFDNDLTINAVGPTNNAYGFMTWSTKNSDTGTGGGTARVGLRSVDDEGVSWDKYLQNHGGNPAPPTAAGDYHLLRPTTSVNSLTIPVNIPLTQMSLTASSFDISDLRLAFQIQKWQERNQRAGVRFKEFLLAHFGIAPRDDRLQRPEYIGGFSTPLVISEVLQTSSTDSTSPQGNLAGHGINIDRFRIGTYRVKEHGFILGLFSIIPKPMYAAQGIHRSFTRNSRFDYYFPEFAHLSEQAVLSRELYSDGSEDDIKIFGFQGRYNELRVMHNQALGNMRDYFSYWHLARIFDTHPLLNGSFIECNPDPRIFAVPSEPGFVVQYANLMNVVRRMPHVPEPGLADHF